MLLWELAKQSLYMMMWFEVHRESSWHRRANTEEQAITHMDGLISDLTASNLDAMSVLQEMLESFITEQNMSLAQG